MSKLLCLKTTLILILMCSSNVFSQLVGSDTQIWEKSTPSLREAGNMREENLVNFHPGIKNRLFKKYIKHSKNKSHTLSLIHTSKENEKIWEREEGKSSLSNDTYKVKNSKKVFKIKRKPSIFTLNSNAEREKGKSDSLQISFEDRNLYELIFIPRKSKPLDINKIHSYLSIKYGISLEKGKYYGSDGKIIWDPEKHKEFKNRPTGLGRDDGNELYQKQSCNQEDQFLSIGKTDIKNLNVENTSVFDHNNFVIWSDDDKKMSLKKDGNFDVLERNWEINFIGSTISKKDYKVRIDKKTINPDNLPLVYWMILKSENGVANKIQGVTDDNYVTFSKVNFIDEHDSDLFNRFTFAVTPLRSDTKDDLQISEGSEITMDQISLDLEQIVLYPNPVKKGAQFNVKFPPMENLNISIYDGGGRLVKLEKIDHKARSYSNSLTTESSYLVTLTKDGKVIKTFKLIVN
ncbi:T9SS type A sorting domain-containing protein [Chryseobacterium indoltheticum]|uniref:Por secretion system C-terminal sorting domain n=1 Tax=Chryseobacterium indoltheticum TaxID=254 RepID=A0A381F4X0_9FLAO|nr:T9SS type A sorting domain-containing protein [Chryseobacterium indoltheticum]AZA75126.1 T9SS C-terminal target domain-containing protein [Chryseobacterium indoltheticum]SIQ54608.1 Por secretion system C-terminal sorting domain-containing protein [Chryseobacterium indoltheticum]SUX41596.1 Por secretion system C-terminal sorting domain [Chryseobacterium indoltheticum]